MRASDFIAGNGLERKAKRKHGQCGLSVAVESILVMRERNEVLLIGGAEPSARGERGEHGRGAELGRADWAATKETEERSGPR